MIEGFLALLLGLFFAWCLWTLITGIGKVLHRISNPRRDDGLPEHWQAIYIVPHAERSRRRHPDPTAPDDEYIEGEAYEDGE